MSTFTPDGQMQSTLHIRVGASFHKEYKWETRETPTDPLVAVNLTGWTAACHLRAKASDATPILTLTTENGGITLGADGSIDLDIDFGVSGTELLNAYKKGVFDIELTNPGQTFRRNLIGGEFIVYGQVTKP